MSVRACALLFSTALLCGQSKDADVAAHLQKGADAQGRRDLQAAVEEFRKALALDPSRAEAQARLGMVYQDLGKLPQAASAFEQALKSAQVSYDSNKLGLEVGVRTNLDVLNQQQQVFQTRFNLAQSYYNFIISALRLKQAVGALTDTDVERVNRDLSG